MIWRMNLTESFNDVFPEDVRSRYFLRETRNATTILRATNPDLFDELTTVLNKFEVISDDLLRAGGQESGLARRFNKELRSRGWREARVDTEIKLELCIMPYKSAGETQTTVTSIPVSNKGYKVDNFQGRVALDLE